MNREPEYLTLRLKVLPIPGWPWSQRLRQLLRTLGRIYRLRVVEIKETFADDPEATRADEPG